MKQYKFSAFDFFTGISASVFNDCTAKFTTVKTIRFDRTMVGTIMLQILNEGE